MPLAQAVIVHGLPTARLAISAASALGRPITLLSAPGAACFAGVGWWRALMAQACPEGTAHVLDCGPAPGRALEALRAGQRMLVLRAPQAVWADIAQRAAACGGEVLAQPPLALDLAVPGADRQLEAWLGRN